VIRGELRIEGDVQQAALAVDENLRQAGHGGGERPVGGDDAQPAGAFGD
jgi:hypothetical protein